MFERGEIGIDTFNKKMSGINEAIKLLDQLYFMTAKPEVIVQRDYLDQIFIENRKKTTIEGVTMIKNSMDHLKNRVDSSKLIELDTTGINEIETSIIISDNIMNGMIKKLKLK